MDLNSLVYRITLKFPRSITIVIGHLNRPVFWGGDICIYFYTSIRYTYLYMTVELRKPLFFKLALYRD